LSGAFFVHRKNLPTFRNKGLAGKKETMPDARQSLFFPKELRENFELEGHGFRRSFCSTFKIFRKCATRIVALFKFFENVQQMEEVGKTACCLRKPNHLSVPKTSRFMAGGKD